MKRVGRWALTVAVVMLLAYAAVRVDWPAVLATARRASPALLAWAVAVNFLSLAIKGVRWWVFLRPIGVTSIALAVRASFVGAGVNNILVANSGEAARVLLVAREGGATRTAVLATLALDRLFDPICYAVLLLCAAWTVRLPDSLARVRAVAVVGLAALLGVVLWLVSRPLAVPSVEPLAGWRGRLRAFVGALGDLASPARMLVAFALSVVVWLLQLATFALVARATGVVLPVGGTVAALLLTNAGLILRATPANVGYFQFAYALAAAPYGVSTSAAVAAALLIQVVQILPVTALAAVWAPGLLKKSS